MKGEIRGTLPELNGELDLQPYVEEFTRMGPGRITAQTTGNFGIKGTDMMYRYDLDHEIQYEGCVAVDKDPGTRAMRFKSSKNYITYDPKEEVPMQNH